MKMVGNSDGNYRGITKLVMLALGMLTAVLAADLGSTAWAAPASPSRSILVVDQSDVRGPFYYQIFSSFRSTVNATSRSPVSIYVESLDLSRFGGPTYEQSLQAHLQVKYQDRPIGVIVAVGDAALEFVLRWRGTLWPGVPVVFSMADETRIAQLSPLSDVTGSIMKLRLSDMMTSARAVVPDLKGVVFVGDAWDGQTVFRHWKEEIPAATVGLDVIDLTGLPMRELRKRVSALPAHTAILYTSIYSDGEGTFFPPADAVALIAESANRPIVVSAETFVGRGGIGGYVMTASAIGREAAQISLRILDGASVASIPPAIGNILQPIFDWRQLRRWGVAESDLPEGSEIRFRDPTLWQQYWWLILLIAAAILIQAALIAGLLYEKSRRRRAETEARQRILELAHMNRHATAGELSASIAHELNQPLGAILNNTEIAEHLLESASPDLTDIKEILADIKRDDQRASEVIKRLRRLLTKSEIQAQNLDLNETLREVFELLSVQASSHDVALNSSLTSEQLPVKGDRIQLQQVILNLVVNGIDAMNGTHTGERKIVGRTALADGVAEVSIADCGPGIPLDKLPHLFEPFFTTKQHGMGMGLSIARTIVEAHGGRIWAENLTGGGAVFRLRLPLTTVH
jgi:signal transduction histidine kinase